MRVDELQNKVQQLVGQQILLKKQFEEVGEEVEKKKGNFAVLEESKKILMAVSLKTQEQISYYISETVTNALRLVFQKEFTFKCEFVVRKRKTECEFILVDVNGNEADPVDSSGGGVLDVISVALRISFWSLNKNRSLFILDEPFKFLSSNYQNRAYEMVDAVSKKLGLQVIVVSHLSSFIDKADRVFVIN